MVALAKQLTYQILSRDEVIEEFHYAAERSGAPPEAVEFRKP
jgi:hypothetical protein